MKYSNFQDYLFTQFEKEEPIDAFRSNDDPEVFNNWLDELDTEQWLNYGDIYFKTQGAMK